LSGFSEVSDYFPALRRGFVNHLMDNAVVPDGERRHLEIARTVMDGHGTVLAARCVLEILRPIVSGIGGQAGADATVAAVVAGLASLEDRRLRVFSIDADGAQGAVDGSDRVAIVVGFLTDPADLVRSIEAARALRTAVVQVIALVDGTGGGAGDALSEMAIPFFPLTTVADLGMSG
jgi:hypothetical protein